MSNVSGDDSPASVLAGLLDVVAFAACELLGAAHVSVAVTQSSGQLGKDVSATVRGWHSTAGQAPRRERLHVTADISADTVTEVDVDVYPDGSARLSPSASPNLSHHKGSGAVDRPALVFRHQPADQIGIVVLVERPTRGRRQQQAQSLSALLDAAAKTVHAEHHRHQEWLRVRLQEREDERRRWARELHDETLQQMGALQVLLTSALRSSRSDAGTRDVVLEALSTSVDMLTHQISSLRHLITELRPATLDELGLSPPLHALARRTEELTGLQVEVDVALRYSDGQLSTRLLPDIEVAVYRVVQEALTNASRHSGGTRARVSVIEDDGQVWVEISDNGNGIHRVAAVPGFGIVGMQERATLAGGRLEVLPARAEESTGDQRGTLIRLVVPATHRPALAGVPPGPDEMATSAEAPHM